MFSYYGKLSTEVYNLTKPPGHSIDGDIEYYTDRLKGVKGQILEAGSGTGRMLIPLLEEGLRVDGIDYSEEMLDSCREHCEKRGLSPQLYQGDLRDFSLPERYDAIIMPTGSFALLDSREAAEKALSLFYQHLNPGGRVIIDLYLPASFQEGEVTTTAFDLGNGEGITLEKKSVETDWIHQQTVTYLKYEKWSMGKLIDTELQQFTLRWYGLEEFIMLLERAGFKEVTCSAGYQFLQQPSNKEQVFTFEAVK
ncbi:class I SAM-dependent methyltransferase [Jeotgalibacillus campisalis]|uniref:Methyltransferase n=1 Tax=Jeotgalibacillus campisalis TaxID=220754 RepID=A0A0C2W2Q0_9BACL|nr:class I SAM-dependent methyltransferase [Jeotgalibacillus campisalis]KIL50901.1 methyltransferase [Jeotgalibacillus campisalis]